MRLGRLFKRLSHAGEVQMASILARSAGRQTEQGPEEWHSGAPAAVPASERYAFPDYKEVISEGKV